MPTLNWLNRDQAVLTSARIPYRLLEELPHHSYGDPKTENMIIHGDNLETLKALLPYYSGKVKCIYIDPPYNTGSALEHYDDNVEHSTWLSLIYPRLELLRDFLSPDGSIWVSIDDKEAHYLKVSSFALLIISYKKAIVHLIIGFATTHFQEEPWPSPLSSRNTICATI